MSTERLNRNFHQFLRTINDWPSLTIEKSALIQMLEDLCHQNPELQHLYDDASTSAINLQSSNDNNNDYSQIDLTDNKSTVQYHVMNQSHQSTTKENSSIRKESNPLPITSPSNTVVKEGNLTVKKGSSILSPLLKKNGLKTSVYGQLSYTYREGEKLVSFTIYQSRTQRKHLHLFILDDTCSFVGGNKRDFSLQHGSAIEHFTTETGTADSWISSFNDVSVQKIEEIYENPNEFSTISGSPSLEQALDTPIRPPPRPFRPTHFNSPENIYVCLYDHYSSTNDSHELEFNCGDVLYIMNTDGPNFYIGYKLPSSSLNNHHPTTMGLVFKDYIKRAYEKVC